MLFSYVTAKYGTGKHDVGMGVERTGSVVFLERKTEGSLKRNSRGKGTMSSLFIVHDKQTKML